MNRTPMLLLLAAALAVGPTRASAAEAPFVIKPDVVYGHKAGMALTYDVIQNKEKNNGAAVMFMMSGGWFSGWTAPEGFVSRQPPFGMGFFRQLAERGYTLAIVRHGSSPYFKAPEAVADVRQAVRHFKEHADEHGVDPSRIGVTGGSAGGHLSLMLGTAPTEEGADAASQEAGRVAAVVAYFPPVDLREWVGPSEQFPALDFDKELADDVSPLLHVTRDDAPTLLVHGDRDKLVPLDNSQRIHAAFQEQGVPCKLIVIPDAGHGFGGKHGEQASAALVAWFDQHLAARTGDTAAAGAEPEQAAGK